MAQRKILAAIFGGILVFRYAAAADDIHAPGFSDYPATVYAGNVLLPSYYARSGNEWRDDAGKEVGPPNINFAGKYHIGLHSCGAECRYYTLSDLEGGADLPILDTFSSGGENPSVTSDGRTYLVSLISRPGSKLLVAQYHIEEAKNLPAECRQRMFVLNEDRKALYSVTLTVKPCYVPTR